jgi:hypothetical protein
MGDEEVKCKEEQKMEDGRWKMEGDGGNSGRISLRGRYHLGTQWGWHYCGTAVALLWHHCGTTMALLWHYCGITVAPMLQMLASLGVLRQASPPSSHYNVAMCIGLCRTLRAAVVM